MILVGKRPQSTLQTPTSKGIPKPSNTKSIGSHLGLMRVIFRGEEYPTITLQTGIHYGVQAAGSGTVRWIATDARIVDPDCLYRRRSIVKLVG
jgi:hypothetical protein